MSTKKINDTVNTPAPTTPDADTARSLLEEARQAREEAQRLLRQVRAALPEPPDPETLAAQEQQRLRGEEPVDILLFRDNGRYKDDVFVSVNGEAIAIRRGQRVTVKRKFWEVLENSRRQDEAAARLMEQQAQQFQASGL